MPPASAATPLPRPVKKWLVLGLAVVVIVVVSALTIYDLPAPPRARFLSIEPTGLSGTMVAVMNFNVTIWAAGPIPAGGLDLRLESLNNGTVCHSADYNNSQPIPGTATLGWRVSVAACLPLGSLSYRFILEVSGTQVDTRTVT